MINDPITFTVVAAMAVVAIAALLTGAKHHGTWPFKKPVILESIPPPTSWEYIGHINVINHRTDKIFSFPSTTEFGLERKYEHGLLYIIQVTKNYPDKKKQVVAELDSEHFSIIHLRKDKYPMADKAPAKPGQ